MDFTTKYVIVILVLNFISYGKSSVKIWKYDFDIHNPTNWVGGMAQTHCDGLDLAEDAYSLTVLDDLNIKKIILPWNGLLALSGAHIEFNEHDKNIMDCARIKLKNIPDYWMDTESWIIKGNEDNAAIPHYEKVPCKYDDIIFPKGFKSSYCKLWDEVEVKSIQFGDHNLTNEDIENDKNLELVFSHNIHDLVHISETTCTDPTGCICRDESRFDVNLCMSVNDIEYFSCLNPIKPIGFCTKMCGASILLKPKSHFQIAKVRESLKRYSSDTYVSKVYNESEKVIQIIFAEKQFSGSSLDEAKDYLLQLLEDETIEANSIELHSSGPYFIEGEISNNSLSIVFGSLCGVVLIFAILFLTYSPRFAALNLTNRFSLSSRSVSSFKSNLFARYHNIENAELILKRQSSSGSMMNLDKAFDNPMFGKSTPSTASTSYGTIYTPDEKITKSEISLENPLYEIHNLDESVQEAAEVDLADLIQKEE